MTDNTPNALALAVDRANQIESLKKAYIPLLREMIVNGRRMSDEQIIGRAAFAAQQGLDPISEVNTIVDKEGRTMSNSMHINGLRRKNQEEVGPGDTIDLEFQEYPKDKMQKDWAYAFECRLRDTQSYRNWQKRITDIGRTLKEVIGNVSYQDIISSCGPAPYSSGIGVVYTAELNEWKDRNFNPAERAKKRAETNARHHRFSTNEPIYDGADTSPGVVIEGSFQEMTVSAPPPAPRSVNDNLSALGYDAPATPKVPWPASVPLETVDVVEGEIVDIPPAPEPAAEQQQEAAPGFPAPSYELNIEVAKAMTNSQGKAYGDMETNVLTAVYNNIEKAILTAEGDRLEELKYKRDAALTVLRAK